jgi:hypothetical protein
MWISLIPSSLLNQNYSVLKALFSDYNNERARVSVKDNTESERASEMGLMGMAVGIAFMIGPAVGTTLFTGYNDAIVAAIALSAISGVLLYMLPKPLGAPDSASTQEGSKTVESSSTGLGSYFLLPAAQLPGSKLLFVMRGGMGIAYHVFSTGISSAALLSTCLVSHHI